MDNDNEQANTLYRIVVKRPGAPFLTFTVNSYTVVDNGAFVEFTDRMTNDILRFPVAIIEIKVKRTTTHEQRT